MKLISLGKFIEKLDYQTNIQDFLTWKAMSEYFDEIFLIVQSPDGKNHQETLDKIHVYWVAQKNNPIVSRLYFMRKSYHVAERLIKEHQIDVLNVGEPVVAGPVAVRLKRRLKKPLVTQVQGQLLNLPSKTFSRMKTKYIEKATLYTCRHSDVIRSVSKEIKQTIANAGISENKICVVQSRCDTDRFCAKNYVLDRNRIRKEIGCGDEDIVIVFTGRIVKYRDLESDLYAVAKVIKKYPKLKFLIVGDGDDLDRIKAISRELGIYHDCCFYGRAAYDDVPKMLAAGDIFLSTSTNEGLSRSVLEAMSMELPVIATKVGGTLELVDDGVNGLLVDVQSPDQIADKLAVLIKDAKLRDQLGKKAREKVLEEFEYHKLIKKFAEIHYL